MLKNNSITIVLKTTHSCNLSCKYCYYSISHKDNDNINLAIVERLFEELCENWQRINIIFHGGEPLILPISLYKDILYLQKKIGFKHSTVFANSIQTNGTIYSREISNFIISNKIGLGISIDGFKDTHDKNRVFKDGQGSYETILENIQKYKADGNKLAAIIVATKEVTEQPQEIYSFFRNLNLDFKINEIVGVCSDKTIAPSQEQLAAFLCKIFDLWILDNTRPVLSIKPIINIVSSFYSDCINVCTHKCECYKYIVVEPNGIVSICGRFNHIKDLELGNINSNGFIDLLNSKNATIVTERVNNLPYECKSCNWLEICNGGCSASALLDNKDLYNKTYWCPARKIIFSHIYHKLESIMEDNNYENK